MGITFVFVVHRDGQILGVFDAMPKAYQFMADRGLTGCSITAHQVNPPSTWQPVVWGGLNDETVWSYEVKWP